MNKIFKRLINYVRFSLIYTENDWIYKNEKDSCDYSKLPSNKGLETKTTELYFKTRKKLKAGWYFFCVNHRGNNPRVIGYISSKNLSFKQWRSFFPNKNRWRIIRINRKSHLQLCLTQVNKSLIINNILLIPIPFIYSKNRIKNRLKEFESISYIKTLDRKRLWKAYNKLFLKKNDLLKSKLISEKDSNLQTDSKCKNIENENVLLQQEISKINNQLSIVQDELESKVNEISNLEEDYNLIKIQLEQIQNEFEKLYITNKNTKRLTYFQNRQLARSVCLLSQLSESAITTTSNYSLPVSSVDILPPINTEIRPNSIQIEFLLKAYSATLFRAKNLIKKMK